MVKRENYLAKLRLYRDQPLIKVVTGIRRAGKSPLLAQFQDELSAGGVAAKQVQSVNFEIPENAGLADWQVLYRHIKANLVKGRKNYVFLDEVQAVKEYERAVDGLAVIPGVDLYITGSNAWMLSSDLATLLSGRYVEISVLPFSFKEFCSAVRSERRADAVFSDYLVYGAFPQAAMLYTIDPAGVYDYLRSLYSTIVLKDVITRKKIADPAALEAVIAYVFDNAGTFLNSHSIAGALTAGGRKISYHTVDTYLAALTDCFLLHPVQRYNIRGKCLLKTNRKYYLADTGMRAMLLGREQAADRGRLLENIVYLELLRRGGQVWIGVNDRQEVDFVVRGADGYTTYYQVAYSVRDEATLARELRGFQGIRDHHPKVLLTLDPEEGTFNGIRQRNALDFLMETGR
jgi:predicted AAA+ superfamily ATPase